MSSNSPPHTNSQTHQLETIGFLATGIAHDFSNLLTSIVGQTSLALATLPQDNVARFHIEKAMQAAEFAAELTRQLLTYASSQDAPDELIDLNELIKDNISLLNTTLLNGVSLQLDLMPNIPPLEAKRAHFQQLIMNLIINACDAVSQKQQDEGVKTLGEIVIGCHLIEDDEQQRVEIYVQDNGCGMSELSCRRAFEAFYTTKDVASGTGLGLSISYDIIQQHDGELTVESLPGVGSVFRFSLPVRT